MPSGKKKKFAVQVAKLESVIVRLESGTVDDIDDMIHEYEKAVGIVKELQARIRTAEVMIEKVATPDIPPDAGDI